jgi:hypothetical protein
MQAGTRCRLNCICSLKFLGTLLLSHSNQKPIIVYRRFTSAMEWYKRRAHQRENLSLTGFIAGTPWYITDAPTPRKDCCLPYNPIVVSFAWWQAAARLTWIVNAWDCSTLQTPTATVLAARTSRNGGQEVR